MGDRGATSYAHTGETTEWEDILVKKGVVTREQVFAAKGLDARDFQTKEEKEAAERALVAAVEEAAAAKEHPLERATLEEMDEAEDEYDDDTALAKYREKRLQELREKAARERFGEVVEISKPEWVTEVTEASQHCWVVVHLYQDRMVECRLLAEVLSAVARKFKAVKFLRILSTSAVENWPDKNLPTLFLYHGGELKHQLLGLQQLGGRSVTAADVEWYLASLKVVETEMDENPRRAGASVRRATGGIRRGYAEGSDDDDNDSD